MSKLKIQKNKACLGDPHPPIYNKKPINKNELTKQYILDKYFKDTKTQPKEVWMIRHGQRIDETNQYYNWAKSIPESKLFDPPLTKLGYEQSKLRGIALKNDLTKLTKKTKTKITKIYCSPLERTIGTVCNIAKDNNLKIIIKPDLSYCAAAVERGKLGFIKTKNKNIDSNNDESKNNELTKEIVLKKWAFYKNIPFLTKSEVIKNYGNLFQIKFEFDYKMIYNNFKVGLIDVMNNNDENITLVVTHREGMGNLDNRFGRFGIPYCAIMKFIYDDIKKEFYYYCYDDESVSYNNVDKQKIEMLNSI